MVIFLFPPGREKRNIQIIPVDPVQKMNTVEMVF
jgi:hypothetical protein